MQILSDLHKEGATIVMVTHNQRDAAYADRIINLFDGRIIEVKRRNGPPQSPPWGRESPLLTSPRGEE
jgi:putative ABC transport system ATP-binding protein